MGGLSRAPPNGTRRRYITKSDLCLRLKPVTGRAAHSAAASHLNHLCDKNVGSAPPAGTPPTTASSCGATRQGHSWGGAARCCARIRHGQHQRKHLQTVTCVSSLLLLLLFLHGQAPAADEPAEHARRAARPRHLPSLHMQRAPSASQHTPWQHPRRRQEAM